MKRWADPNNREHLVALVEAVSQVAVVSQFVVEVASRVEAVGAVAIANQVAVESRAEAVAPPAQTETASHTETVAPPALVEAEAPTPLWHHLRNLLHKRNCFLVLS